VHIAELSAPEQRVLGCLIEKRWTTPDQYPLSLNSLRLASYHSSRSIKYRHLAEEALGLDRPQLAVLAVLLLRGEQTPGELKGRTERMAQIGTLAEVERILETLGERGYARRLPRRPGQKEDRFIQLLGGGDPAPGRPPDEAAAALPAQSVAAPSSSSLEQRVAALEAEVAALRAEIRSAAPAPPGT
jgi:hypothetical protein